MFRKIRKTKSEIGLQDAKRLLETQRRGVLAVNGDGGYPYAIPLDYLYCEQENKLYFHGARTGHKADALKASDKVCFVVTGDEVRKTGEWAPYVQSAVAFGRCRAVEDRERCLALLERLAQKYYPGEKEVREEMNAAGSAAQIFEMQIEYLTGKQVQEK